MKYIRIPSIRSYRFLLILSFFFLCSLYFIIFEKSKIKSVPKLEQFIEESKNSFNEIARYDQKYPVVTDYERKDWHDWDFLQKENLRNGPGERGKPYKLTDPEDIKLNEKLFKIEGLYALVSDKISVNRSVPDTRLPICKTIKYLKKLPTTSIIIIFHNEYFSILLRTIHSVYNRAPRELLHEIILVNDASTKKELYEPLQDYVNENFDERVKIVNLPERKGLIVTRMEGARRASGEVLLFLDSHMEANTNFLPPLLEPIALEPRTATVPIVDNFFHDTFEYGSGGKGSRGVFDWKFEFHWLPRRRKDKIHPEKPAPTPIMLGCAFAIRRDYFFDLGAYDEQLMIWNGENYELSFKLWLCGGQLLEVPCSRIAHTFRKHNEWRKRKDVDFVGHNFKRIAEVWLDEYKEFLYKTDPKRFQKIDAGDLTREKLIREKLHCKPFSYMLEHVMPDMLDKFPLKDPGAFAHGAIISDLNKKLCVDTLGREHNEAIGLYPCHKDREHPDGTQNFVLNWNKQIKIRDYYDNCLDVYNVSIRGCHFTFGNQYWKYDLATHHLFSPPDNCLTGIIEAKELKVKTCELGERSQMWSWGYVNVTALLNWNNEGSRMLYLSGRIKKFDLLSFILIFCSVIVSFILIRNYYEHRTNQYQSETSTYKEYINYLKRKMSAPRYPFANTYERKDYHDYEFMRAEEMREGPGEHGEKYLLKDPDDIARNKQLFKQFGFFAVGSDHISVNRSLPDVRMESCKSKRQLVQLPKVSIIIVFFDEYWSILLRTIHSIYNRTPHELLHEIILVNDNSTVPELYEPLQNYVKENFGDIVWIYNLNERKGLAVGRMKGAKRAKAEVLVFLDSQVEVNVNWLPPLLEPIALAPNLITTPIVDSFAYDTFEYRKIDDGGRGIFNWNLNYRRVPRRPEDSVNLDEPIPNPIMHGAAFAINRLNFWEIGAYDDGLKVWQGEQLELSLKAHLCGEGIVEIPCSHVAHSFRNKNYYQRFEENGVDYMMRNFKRVAEVWLEDYKHLVYDMNREKYDQTNAGNLAQAKLFKRNAHCKPFKYFLEFVAPEIVERYPIYDPGHFAQSTIQSKANSNLCIEVPKAAHMQKISLVECDENRLEPSPKQFFKLAWHRNIQHSTFDFCLQESLTMSECHYLGGNQLWKYDIETYQIIKLKQDNPKCLTADVESRKIYLDNCDSEDIKQKWNWGEKNISALQNWETFGMTLSKLSLD
ncbi:CLUMA_CG009999, isoform A [Clunio marinus]|uniref:CLUMA_CG009999, isoform A n=1 Tax=Clunio marinus TaxID=568069 RepID=A0A1J1IDS8_9DIPT|nr:CLUMA_CG009999, isoform A [Clunio marinus]